MHPVVKAQPSQPRVLVVEDDVLIRILLSEALREAGIMIVEAANADEALSYIAAGEPFDLVFSDVRMPGSIDGVELARRLRRHSPSLPIILTSGNLGSAFAAELGMFLQKPYDIEQTVLLIASMIDHNLDKGAL